MTTLDLIAAVTPGRIFRRPPSGRPSSIWGHLQIALAVVVLAVLATLASSVADTWRVGTVATQQADFTQFDQAASVAFTTSAGMRTLADDLLALRLQSEAPASSTIDTQMQIWAAQLNNLQAFLTEQRSGAAVATVATALENLTSIDRTLNSVTWQPAFLDSSAAVLNQTARSLDDVKLEVLRLESIERSVAAKTLETASENAVSRLGIKVAVLAGIGVTVALAAVAIGLGVAQATRNSNSMAPSSTSMRSVSVARTRFTRKLGSVVHSGLTAARRTVMAALVRLTMI